MKLNPVEMAFINNPLRGIALRRTVDWLWSAACAPPVERVLEVGCGQGDGAREILRRFHARQVDAFDLDEVQVNRARARLGDLDGAVRLWVGDAERIDAPDESVTDVPIVSALLRRFTLHPWDCMFDFPLFRRTLAEQGFRLTALRSRALPGWHEGVAVRA